MNERGGVEGGGILQSAGVDLFDMVCVAGTGNYKRTRANRSQGQWCYCCWKSKLSLRTLQI